MLTEDHTSTRLQHRLWHPVGEIRHAPGLFDAWPSPAVLKHRPDFGLEREPPAQRRVRRHDARHERRGTRYIDDRPGHSRNWQSVEFPDMPLGEPRGVLDD